MACIGEILGQFLVAFRARPPVAHGQRVALRHLAAALADLSADAEDFEADIDAVGDGTLIGILGDEVLAEKTERVE